MRLLKRDDHGTFILRTIPTEYNEPYAILSHTWLTNSDEEVTFQDLSNGTGDMKPGFKKLDFCATQARRDGLEYFWIDTCCIDKTSSAELSESLISMFRWYEESTVCYVYLSDVRKAQLGHHSASVSNAIRLSRWFTRGWALQELLAPSRLEFFDSDGILLGDKLSLIRDIHEATGIDFGALRGLPLNTYSEGDRMQWAAHRRTTRPEDKAYCLQGIFDVVLAPQYSEGLEKATKRLRDAIKESIRGKITI